MISDQIFLVGLIVFFASLLQGMFGFAFMLVALPLLSLLTSVKMAVPFLSLFLVFSTGYLTFKHWGIFEPKKLLPLLIGAMPGIPLGILSLGAFSERTIKMTLGMIMTCYSLYAIVGRGTTRRLPVWSGYAFGFLSGALGGAYNMTGPPVIFFIASQGWAKSTTFVSLNGFFLLTTVGIIAFHFAFGNMQPEMLKSFLFLLPAMIAGLAVGMYGFEKLNDERYRKGLFVLLLFMGILLLR